MSRLRTAALVVAILIIALNLRPAVVAVSPLIGQIRADLGINGTVAGLLTTLPVLFFGLLAPVAPRLTRRWGLEATLMLTLVVLVAGILLRLAPSLAALLAGSVLAGAAIATGNTLMPTLVKRDFPHHTGAMTGAYSVMLSGGGALAAGVMVPIEHATGLGWRPAIALWAILGALGIALWAPWVLRARRNRAAVAAPPVVRGVWTSALAWQVTLFMGLQSLEFYSITAWIPSVFVDAGRSASAAGLLLSLSGIASLLTSYFAPVLAARRPTQYHLVVAYVVLLVIGYGGVLLAPGALAPLWMVLIGFSQGIGISLALTMITLRSPDAHHTAQLSGMAQGVGYVIASAGPLTLGALHDATGGWTIPMIVLVAVLVPILAFGLGAARNRHIGRAAPAEAEGDDAAGAARTVENPAQMRNGSSTPPRTATADDGAGTGVEIPPHRRDGISTPPATATATLGGRVRRADGTAVAGAVVTLVDEHGAELDRTATGLDGAYALRAPGGPAILVCSAPDHAPSAVRTSAGGAVDVELRPRGPAVTV